LLKFKKREAKVKILKRNQKRSFNKEKIKKANFTNILKVIYKAVTTIRVLEKILKEAIMTKKKKIIRTLHKMGILLMKINNSIS